MNTQNVNTAASESTETRGEGQKHINLTRAQFADLCDYLVANGTFAGPGGLYWRDCNVLDAIAEPTDEPEARMVYTWKGWPVALYEFDIGYTLISAALNASLNMDKAQ
ncbi:MAG: hypothetical protein PW844_20680 [Pantoea sp.]|uniref:hypothetical protein n=1 Tax=Pantoea sp. TaxID=69393 RepID=UPI00238593B3|nr:hypothetical protein [Pantoea sp.]MDE1188848.1 hypothetical protein [Pantoea sp.]